MPEWVPQLWAVIQQAGAAGAALLSVAVYLLLKDRERILAELKELQGVVFASQEKRIADSHVLIPIMQKSTDLQEKIVALAMLNAPARRSE